MVRRLLLTRLPAGLLLAGAIGSASAGAGDWLQWGGPAGDFIVPAATLAESWPAGGPRRVWERRLGEGYSSVLAAGPILVTMYRQGNDEIVVSLDARNGSTRWEHRDTPALWPDMTLEFGKGPNGTPLIAGRRVVAIGISGRMRCLDLDTGKLLWQRDLPADFGRLKRVEEYGYSGSPLLYEGLVLTLVGGDKAAVVALDPADGSIRWVSPSGGVSYAPPSIVRLAGQEQFVYFEPEGVAALDPRTGALLWKSPIEFNNGNHLTPAVACDENHLWVGSQFETGGGRLLHISRQPAPSGKGAARGAPGGGALTARQLWFDAALRASHWPLIRQGDLIYGSIGTNGTSHITAFRWKTGEVLWKVPGFHKAQALWADGKILFLDESGQLVLARAAPAGLNVLARTQVARPRAWTLPTLAGSIAYLRDQEKVLALDLSASR